jgi:hypothetical protein
MRRVPPGRHIFVARDPGASAGDESSLGSIDALPPPNRHGYAEWNFSGVPDPVMFRRFLDAMDYWFGCSDDSSTGSYDPARECYAVITNDPANAAGAVGAGDGEVTPAPGIAMPAPSTPEARDLHREVQTLIEQAAVQQAESSDSRIRQQGDARDDEAAPGGEPSVHAEGPVG